MSHLHPNPVRTACRATLGALALALAAAGPALAQEGDARVAWSQFQGDPGHSGSLAEAPEPPYRQLWRFGPPTGALSGAVIGGETAIAVGESAVYALDLATGEVAWEVPRAGGRISMPALGTGPEGPVLVFLEGPGVTTEGSEATPTPSPTAVADEEAGGVTDLVAVSVATREELWRTALQAASRSGVTVSGDLVVVGDDDGTVYGVELATGAAVWTADTVGRVEAPPAVADGRVYVTSRDAGGQRAELVALDERTGEPAWTFAPQAGAVAASAPSTGEGSVVIGSADRLVRRLSAEGGEVLWDSLTLTLFSPVTAPAFSGGDLVVADASGGVYRLDPQDGGRRWEHQLNELIVRSAPVLTSAHILVGLNDGRLVALDPANGDLVWQSTPSAGLIGAIGLSPQVVLAVKGGQRPGLIAFAHDPQGSLVRIASPTVVDARRLYGNFALAMLLACVVIYVPFRFLRARMGPAFGDGGEAIDGEPDPGSPDDLDDPGSGPEGKRE